MNNTKLRAHHIGCLTSDMQSSIAAYRKLGFQNISEVTFVSSQKVKVCFVEIKQGFYLELVEISETNHALQKIFKSNNPYYHVGYLVDGIDVCIADLELEGYHIVSQFDSEAFDGKRCAFMYSPEMHLIELIEE
ncbi:MAG: VOC family protein [Bacteroidetes bacterium]|nr:VOC family protein [Bacteroidota bacterium]